MLPSSLLGPWVPISGCSQASVMNRAAARRCDGPARTLIECSWHFPGSVRIPTGICLALEKGAKFLPANTKTKDISVCQALSLGAGRWAETMLGSSGSLLSSCQACCKSSRSLPLPVFPGAHPFHTREGLLETWAVLSFPCLALCSAAFVR